MQRRDFFALLGTSFAGSLYGNSFSLEDINKMHALENTFKKISKISYSEKVDFVVNYYMKYKLPQMLVKNDVIQNAIRQISLPLFKVSNRILNWKIFIVDTKVENAYTCGGGLIFIEKNLIKLCQNETQLASVIAHEIGHVHYKHAERRYIQNDLFKSLDLNNINKFNFTLLNKSYSRIWEHEADAFIIKSFLETNYSIAHASSFFKRLQKKYPGSTNINTCVFSTHPQHKNRINKLEAIASTFSQFSYKKEDSKDFKYLKEWSMS